MNAFSKVEIEMQIFAIFLIRWSVEFPWRQSENRQFELKSLIWSKKKNAIIGKYAYINNALMIIISLDCNLCLSEKLESILTFIHQQGRPSNWYLQLNELNGLKQTNLT